MCLRRTALFVLLVAAMVVVLFWARSRGLVHW